jgi:hypothetical protein
MLDSIFWFCLGLIIGWNIPQPEWLTKYTHAAFWLLAAGLKKLIVWLYNVIKGLVNQGVVCLKKSVGKVK